MWDEGGLHFLLALVLIVTACCAFAEDTSGSGGGGERTEIKAAGKDTRKANAAASFTQSTVT